MKPLHTLIPYNLNRFGEEASNLLEVDLLTALNVIFTTIGPCVDFWGFTVCTFSFACLSCRLCRRGWCFVISAPLFWFAENCPSLCISFYFPQCQKKTDFKLKPSPKTHGQDDACTHQTKGCNTRVATPS